MLLLIAAAATCVPPVLKLELQSVPLCRMLSANVAFLLDILPSAEAEVLALRYGVHDGQPKTHRYIGGHLGMSHERVRQIEASAKRRLAGSKLSQLLALGEKLSVKGSPWAGML